MQPAPETKTAAQPVAPSAPFMDVTPPRPADATPPAPASTPVPEAPAPSAPAEQNLGPKDPPAEQDDPEHHVDEPAAKPAVSKKVKTPKAPSNGVGMIILVAFVVMIVLAGLAVYAYMQTK